MAMELDDKSKCAEYGRRGSAKRRAQIYMIEGESLTMIQIAARLGIPYDTTQKRYARLLRSGAAQITWKALGMKDGAAK